MSCERVSRLNPEPDIFFLCALEQWVATATSREALKGRALYRQLGRLEQVQGREGEEVSFVAVPRRRERRRLLLAPLPLRQREHLAYQRHWFRGPGLASLLPDAPPPRRGYGGGQS